MKFPTENGVGIIKGDPKATRECYIAELVEARKKERNKNVEASLHIRDSPL